MLDIVKEGNKTSMTCSHKVENKGFESPCPCAGPISYPPLSDIGLPIVKARGGEDELLKAAEVHFPNEMELAHRVLEDSELHDAANNLCQWHGQGA